MLSNRAPACADDAYFLASPEIFRRSADGTWQPYADAGFRAVGAPGESWCDQTGTTGCFPLFDPSPNQPFSELWYNFSPREPGTYRIFFDIYDHAGDRCLAGDIDGCVALRRLQPESPPGFGRLWSQVEVAQVAPEAPRLLLPAPGAVVETTQPELSWARPEGAEDFRIFASTSLAALRSIERHEDRCGGDCVVNGAVRQATALTIPPGVLQPGDRVYWMVRAEAGAARSDRSEIREFTVDDPEGPACPSVDLLDPAAEVEVAPGDPVRIAWNGEAQGAAVVAVGYDNDRIQGGGTVIAGGLAEDGETAWDTAGVPDGRYFLYVTIDDGQCVRTRYADAAVNIGRVCDPNDPGPGVHYVDIWHDGRGFAQLKAHATAFSGDVSVEMEFDGEVRQGEPRGGALFAAPFSYAASGKYPYRVTVTDECGRTDTFGPAEIGLAWSVDQGTHPIEGGTCSGNGEGTQGGAGDPVNTHNGNFVHTWKHDVIPGVGGDDIRLELTYNSQASFAPAASIIRATEDGETLTILRGPRQPYGPGWSFPYQAHVLVVNEAPAFDGAQVVYGDGRTVLFRRVGDRYTAVTPGLRDVLERVDGGFVLRESCCTLARRRFDADGRLVEIADRNGNTVSLSYEDGELIRIQNASGRAVDFVWNDGRIISARLPDGSERRFEYVAGRLAAYVDGTDDRTRYEYDDEGMLTAVITPRGHPAIRMEYDDVFRVVSQTVGEAERRTFFYEPGPAARTTVTDVHGNRLVHVYDASRRLVRVEHPDGAWESFAYDEAFNRTFHRARSGAEWRWTYDDRGNRISASGPLDWFRGWSYDLHNQVTELVEVINDDTVRETAFSYDARGNRTSTCNALGDCATAEYDERGLPTQRIGFAGDRTTFEHDAAGNLRARTDADGHTTEYEYDALGRRTSMTTPEDYVTRYGFDADGQLVRVEGPDGEVETYAYDANGNRTSMTDPNGGQTTYAYDRSDRLRRVTNPLNFHTTTRTYGPMGELLADEDAEGRVTRYEHDSMLRIRHRMGPLDTQEWLAYDEGGNLTDLTDARGYVTHVDYDALSRPVRETRNYLPDDPAAADVNVTRTTRYDGVGSVVAVVDAEGNETTYEYDILGRRTRTVDAEGNETLIAYDAAGKVVWEQDPNGAVTTRTYTPGQRPFEIIDALDGVTTFQHDGDGRLIEVRDAVGVTTRYEYDGSGRRTLQVQNYQANVAADATHNVSTGYAYDAAGNLRFVTSPRGDVAEMRYDAAKRLVSSVDFAGGETTYRHDRVNNLLSVEDDNGNMVTHAYDALDRKISTTDAEGHVQAYEYDAGGYMTGRTDRNGNRTTYRTDALGRRTAMIDALGGEWTTGFGLMGQVLSRADANGHVTTYEYDRIYRRRSMTLPEGNVTQYAWDPAGNLVEVVDAEGNPTAYTHDPLNRLVAATNAEEETAAFSYDPVGNRTRAEAPDGQVTTYGFDELRRLVEVVQNFREGEDASNDVNLTTAYRYDPSSNLAAVINAIGGTTAFRYDPMGRVLRETDPLGSVWEYGYDGVGNRLRRRDANGQVTTYGYFPDNQLRSTASGDGTRIEFAYDPNNNRTLMEDGLGVTTWEYDALDRLTATSDPFDRSLERAYDPVGNRLSQTYPNGTRVGYTFSRNNWLRSVELPDAGWTRYERDLVGNVSAIENSNNTATAVERDGIYRVTYMSNVQRRRGDVINSAYAYLYDRAGRVLEESAVYGWRQPAGETTTYVYDGVGRLADVSRVAEGQGRNHAGFSAAYVYDAVGNRLSYVVDDDPTTQRPRDGFQKTYAYDDASRLLEVVTDGGRNRRVEETVSFTYDPNGNRLSKETDDGNGPVLGSEYDYDFENRLVSVQDYQAVGRDQGNRIDQALTELAYDGIGRRLVKTYDPNAGGGGQKRVEYAFDGFDPIAEYERLNGQHTEYYRGDRNRLVSMLRFPAGAQGQQYWYHFNRKDDVVGLTKHAGQSHHNYRYDPYGAVLPENGNFQDPHNHYGLTGKEHDEHTGLVWFGARHYDPAVGVWITQDSYRGEIGDPRTLHRLKYVSSDPVNNIDKYGFYTFFVVADPYYSFSGGPYLAPPATSSVTPKEAAKEVADFLLLDDLTVATTGVDPNTGEDVGFGGRVFAACMVLPVGKVFKLFKLGKLKKVTPSSNVLKPKLLDDVHPSTPVGHRSGPINVKPGTNLPTVIGDRKFTGHALDQMQGRGIVPSVVENAIQHGAKSVGNQPNTFLHVADGVKVVTNSVGDVITVIPQ